MDETADTTDAEVGYERTCDDAWAQRALGFYQSRQLQMQAFNTDGVISAQVWGACPRCGHSLDIQMTLTAPVVSWRGGWSSVGRKGDAGIPADIEVGCGCGLAHGGAPENVTGCGVSFRLPTAPTAP
jgi:hypothetical protein